MNNPSRWWHDLLDEVSEIVNSSSTTSFDEKSVLDDDLQEFTDLSLRVLVETNLTELLETTLKWMEDVNGGDFCYLNKDLKTNNQVDRGLWKHRVFSTRFWGFVPTRQWCERASATTLSR